MLNDQEFAKLTKLCRISCSEEEKQGFLKSLDDILKYVAQLGEVNTENVATCYTVLEDLSNVLRDDTPGEYLAREAFLENAPAHVGSMIKVPSVIKQG